MPVEQESFTPGPVVLFGSGETSPSGQKVFDYILKRLPAEPRLALLETPAGFELNSSQVIGRVAEFLNVRLQNYHPRITVVPARARHTAFSPDDPELAAPLLGAEMIFMGPGSPSYAVRQLMDSVTWKYLIARHRLGATIALASAAIISVSAFALPVYEIYKVGEDPHWKPGLDLFGAYGLPLVLVPHWNNNDGGAELDTSRCFMGKKRFARLIEQLPPGLTVIGIDEKTALVLEPNAGTAHVIGLGGVTLIHTGHAHAEKEAPNLSGSDLDELARQYGSHIHQHRHGETFPLAECCPMSMPDPDEGLPEAVWQRALQAEAALKAERQQAPQSADESAAPAEVQALVAERQAARQQRDWAQSDHLRQQIEALGWQVKDTPSGPVLSRREEE